MNVRYKKYTYISMINTDSYVKGVICLYESLKKVKSKYPFHVLITEEVSLKSEEILNKYGINVIRTKEKIELPKWVIDRNIEGNMKHWNNSFDKLLIFELVQFDKIVYLDSDMFVIDNIDNLFNKKHISGVIAGESFPDDYYKNWSRDKFCSGLLVIEPQSNIINKFIKSFDKIESIDGCLGDQEILWEYFDEWPNNRQLKLDEKYMVFFEHLDYYMKNFKYDIYNKRCKNNIATIHFAAPKPWFLNEKQKFKYLVFNLFKFKFKIVKLLLSYFIILNKIEKEF